MKCKIIFFSWCWFVISSSTLNAQIDTTRREFYPLGLGDLWQYRNEQGNLYPNSQVVDDDTLMPNGANYAVIGSPAPPYVFDRIDGSWRVQWYAPWASDSCGGSFPQEASVYRLGEDSGRVWKDCYNWNGFLGLPLIRYGGIQLRIIFGQIRETMIFEHGYISPETGDTVFATQDWLVRGIGLYFRQYWWSGGYDYLSGAIISGVQYGTIVGIGDIPTTIPRRFVLYQNYPNPFNAQTILEYEVPTPGQIEITVFDILGRVITYSKIRYEVAGRYIHAINLNDKSSGFYVASVRFMSNTSVLVERRIKMLLIK